MADRAIELDGSLKNAYFKKGLALLRSGRYSESVTANEQALARDPLFETAVYNIACAYSLMGNVQLTADYLKRSTEMNQGRVHWARRDVDLDPVRDHPQIKKLLEEQ